jgi:cobalamin-dependent methionine synthase I
MDVSFEGQDIVTPQFFGGSQVLRWDADALLSAIDVLRLSKDTIAAGVFTDEEFRREFDRLTYEIIADNLLDAAGLYCIFPVYTDDARIFFLDPDDYRTHLAEFFFPRSKNGDDRSIADYLRPEGDVVAVQIVSLGSMIDERCRKYRDEADGGRVADILTAIGKSLLEVIAHKTTAEIRRAFFVPKDRGLCFNIGSPGIPGLEEQGILMEILGAEERLGVCLTPEFKLKPRFSEMGFFVHHPEAGKL